MKGTAPEKIILITLQERQRRQTVESKKLKGRGKADSKKINPKEECAPDVSSVYFAVL